MAKPKTRWRSRIQNLIAAAKDVAPEDHPSSAKSDLSKKHRALFKEYLAELGEAKETAEGWWGALILAEEERTDDHDQAVENVEERRPVGPSVHGSVIAVVRKYWLACDSLNRLVDRPERVPPEEFVLGRLVDGNHDDFAEFLAGFPFWPIGLDREGNWI
jgi:hypothetical protein